jgi:hypothetical protein
LLSGFDVRHPGMTQNGSGVHDRAGVALEGKSARDVRRCLKRAVARQLFKLLEWLDRSGVELVSAW